MRISDWSSDVCSSDLFRACTAPCDPPRRTDRQPPAVTTPATPDSPDAAPPLTIVVGCDTFSPDINGAARFAERLSARSEERRVGKECVIRVDLGGRRIIKKKKIHNN